MTAESDTPADIFAAHRHNMRVCGIAKARHEGLSEVVRERQRILEQQE